ncbi:MAG TPA: ABC transporter permease [Ensifer sp.]|nr:ABC transporter permease [Ensifer sp.]
MTAGERSIRTGLFPASAGGPWLIRRFAASEGAAQLLAIAVLLGIWWAFSRWGGINPFLLPSPEVVGQRLLRQFNSGELAANISATMYAAIAGFAIAVIIGVPLGLAMARNRIAGWFFAPIVSVGFPAPKLAFLPIFLLWFDVGASSKIVMVAFAAVFIVASATAAGAAYVPRPLLWSAQSLGASRTAMLWQVIVPSALPQILNGLQIALPVCLITTIAAEMYVGGAGIGGAMLAASRFANTPDVFAGLIISGATGLVLVRLIGWIRVKLLHWHAEARVK